MNSNSSGTSDSRRGSGGNNKSTSYCSQRNASGRGGRGRHGRFSSHKKSSYSSSSSRNNYNRRNARRRCQDGGSMMSDEDVLVSFTPYLRADDPEALRIHEKYIACNSSQNSKEEHLFLEAVRLFLVSKEKEESIKGEIMKVQEKEVNESVKNINSDCVTVNNDVNVVDDIQVEVRSLELVKDVESEETCSKEIKDITAVNGLIKTIPPSIQNDHATKEEVEKTNETEKKRSKEGCETLCEAYGAKSTWNDICK